MNSILLSLCIPTNGIIEWVFPVLDSIYRQKANNKKFEVIVTDNGVNEDFKYRMESYALQHDNLIYKRTDAYMFENQIEAVKLASGKYIKFINHRAILKNGVIDFFIDFIQKNQKDKPVIYFSNGILHGKSYEYNSFNDFIAKLGRYVSWTTGVGIWKEHFDAIPKDRKIDKISPHSYLLFAERNNKKYIINDIVFSEEIENDHSKKGKYDLYKAFAVEEFLIILNLFVDGDISADTVKRVKHDYRKFVSELYWRFTVKKSPCSYKIDGFNDAMDIIFTRKEIIIGAYIVGIKKMLKKIKGKLVKNDSF